MKKKKEKIPYHLLTQEERDRQNTATMLKGLIIVPIIGIVGFFVVIYIFGTFIEGMANSLVMIRSPLLVILFVGFVSFIAYNVGKAVYSLFRKILSKQ